MNRSLTRAAFLRLAGAAAGAAALGLPGSVMAQTAPIMTRPIPKTGEPLPAVGLGTWLTFDIGSDPEDWGERERVLHTLLEGGGSVIDSSPMYGPAESVVGDLLGKMDARDRAFLATKVWTRGRASGIAQITESLQRFKTPQIDLMQIHNLLDWPTHLATLRDWKEKGTFRYIGITHHMTHALDELSAIIETEPVDFVQMAYSIDVRAAERRLLPLAQDRQVAVLVNRPFGGGGLLRRLRAAPLPDWAGEIGAESWAQFLLKFILGHPAVTCVIPGTSRARHMADNLGAGRGPLPDEQTRERMARHMETM